MTVAIVTIGSQGDIVPFLALALGLKRHGHEVRIAAFDRFRSVVERHGFAFSPLSGDADEVIRTLIGMNVGPVRYFRGLDRMMETWGDRLLRDVSAACGNADAVVYSLLGSVAWHMAEKAGIRAFRAFPCPLDPTPTFPAMTAPRLPLGGPYNLLTYGAGDLLWGRATKKHLAGWRASMGLPALRGTGFPYRSLRGKPVPTLYMFSPSVLPAPAGWQPHHHVTGYWFLDESGGWRAPAGLQGFLEKGEPPLYVGFGSMLGGSFRQALETIVSSLKRTGRRAVLSSGWGNLAQADLPDFVHKADYVPHDWLFPRVSAVIHHGGAGTTAAGLRAGRPTLVVPFGGDQPFWGSVVHGLGVGPRPISRSRLSVERLSDAIAVMTGDAGMSARAAELAARIGGEDGVGNAVRIIEAGTP